MGQKRGITQRPNGVRVLREHADAIRALGATGVYVFGWTACDEAPSDSSLDLFIDYNEDGTFSLLEMITLNEHLEQRVHQSADITVRDSLYPLPRDRILAEAERIF